MFNPIGQGEQPTFPIHEAQQERTADICSGPESEAKVSETGLHRIASSDSSFAAEGIVKGSHASKRKIADQEDPLESVPERKIARVDESDSTCAFSEEIVECVVRFFDCRELGICSFASSQMRRITFPLLFERITGETVEETLHNAIEHSNKVCHRFEKFYVKHVPQDVVDLYEHVRKRRDHASVEKLETFLDYRDNLIFWKKIGASSFEVHKANSFQEVEEAYSAINPHRFNPDINKLELNFLHLTSIPSDLLKFFQIEELYLQGNYITDVPENLVKQRRLNALNLSGNKISSLPASFFKLVNLEHLRLDSNELSPLPDSFGNLINLQLLGLDDCKLSSLPDSFGNLAQLQKLWLEKNRLSSLPSSFGNLVNLRKLDLGGNQVSSLPDSFGNLVNLRELRLTRNQFSSLPDSFGNLIQLQKLSLSKNQFSSLPRWFDNLVNLRKLALGGNQLSSLPDSFGNLIKLQRLELSNNQFSSLPRWFGKLAELKYLAIDEKLTDFLPKPLGKLRKVALRHLRDPYFHTPYFSIIDWPNPMAEPLTEELYEETYNEFIGS